MFTRHWKVKSLKCVNCAAPSYFAWVCWVLKGMKTSESGFRLFHLLPIEMCLLWELKITIRNGWNCVAPLKKIRFFRTPWSTKWLIKMEISAASELKREHINLYSAQLPEEVKHLSPSNLALWYWKRHIWHSLSVLAKEKRKKMEMFDKLLSRQKQKRDGGGRCWWQVYYATEATGEANNWEMELSQHFLQNAPHQRVSLCHSSRQDEITHPDILHLSLKLCQCSVYVTSNLDWEIYSVCYFVIL